MAVFQIKSLEFKMIHRLWIEKERLISTLARLKKWLIGASTKILPNGVC